MKKLERIYHTWEKWESFRAGFFNNNPPNGMSKQEAEQNYFKLLSNPHEFAIVLECVLVEWPYSVEHNLTNKTLNRIAWMGQAALAYKYNIPAHFRGGYNLLSKEQQAAADAVALKYINIWMERNGYPPVEAEVAEAASVKQSLY